MTDFSKWWNRNQPMIEDGFQTPVMTHALRVAETAYNAGVETGKRQAQTNAQQLHGEICSAHIVCAAPRERKQSGSGDG